MAAPLVEVKLNQSGDAERTVTPRAGHTLTPIRNAYVEGFFLYLGSAGAEAKPWVFIGKSRVFIGSGWGYKQPQLGHDPPCSDILIFFPSASSTWG